MGWDCSAQVAQYPAYARMQRQFARKGYKRGVKDDTPIYTWPRERRRSSELLAELKVGHYINGIENNYIGLSDVPDQFRTREFFVHVAHKSSDDASRYVLAHIKQFGKQFFKDVIATSKYSIMFDDNIFEWMPLKYIDEEMAMCAMFKSMGEWSCYGWLFSIHKRKPEALTREIYILSARCFGVRDTFAKDLIDMTPKEYRTREFYLALCYSNHDPVMKFVPKRTLTNKFIMDAYNANRESIECFTEEALEREIETPRFGKRKVWQFAILDDAGAISRIAMNDERAEFFMSLYDKDSFEYDLYFKDRYKSYLRKKNGKAPRKDSITEASGMMALAIAMGGSSVNEAIDVGTKVATGSVNREAQLPIKFRGRVPAEYCKQFDREEFLLEIYKKLGIEVLGEADYYYYDVVLPEALKIVRENYGYALKEGDKSLLHYRDVGPFYDRDVDVDEVFVAL